LEAGGQWRVAVLNFGEVACCTLAAFVVAADSLLAADLWALVANRPARPAA
jgi:hypothetical protein